MPGIGSYFFTEKSNQKLSPAPFAINGSALTSSPVPQMPRANKA
jgi:hypothetical protein